MPQANLGAVDGPKGERLDDAKHPFFVQVRSKRDAICVPCGLRAPSAAHLYSRRLTGPTR